jgi:nicotinate-nucleotide pyrophosphorylase (carboxylating)
MVRGPTYRQPRRGVTQKSGPGAAEFGLQPPPPRRHAAGVELTAKEIETAVRRALDEDVGRGDVTTAALIPARARARARLVAREPLTVAGLEFAVAAFRALAADLRVERAVHDGAAVPAGAVLLRLEGPARALLTAERTALNFVQRLSGVATLTARFVAAVAGTGARLLDTRKTTPGWRRFEKYAVACGGGQNHRLGLFDQVLIKDNHLVALRGRRPNPIAWAVRRARAACPGLFVEVEADTLAQVRQAVAAGADGILLDNMSPAQLRRAVRLVAGRARTEASGGVRLDNVRAIAESGVDFISVGALTHSAPAVDVALDFEPRPARRPARA